MADFVSHNEFGTYKNGINQRFDEVDKRVLTVLENIEKQVESNTKRVDKLWKCFYIGYGVLMAIMLFISNSDKLGGILKALAK